MEHREGQPGQPQAADLLHYPDGEVSGSSRNPAGHTWPCLGFAVSLTSLALCGVSLATPISP
jgi:hypothetical protein